MESDIVTAWIKVRIKDYNGLPRGSPAHSSYFDHSLHASDRYSIGFSFVPKRDIPGNDLVMGFDYDHSIKHQLPPGFKYAMKIATSFLDPGLYSDPYCDEPYLYGPALSSFFAFRIGERTEKMAADEQLAHLEQEAGGVVEEGAEGSGQSVREELGLPTMWKKRRKHFLNAQALEGFTFEKGRLYHADFFNPHLDFANFSLRLPGFSISVARYIDEKTHHLRFVLKDRKTEEALFVVFMKLLFGKELEEKKKLEKERAPSAGAESMKKEAQGDVQSNMTASSKASASPKLSPVATPEPIEEHKKEPSAGGTATAAATGLANSIYSVYVALGFIDQASSESETESRGASPRRSDRCINARIDDMEDSAIENYLKSRNDSTK